MSFSANTVTGKIAAVFLPVMLFVLCGFEHSVANMFYVPAGMVVGGMNGIVAPTMQEFLLNNLLPVTIGNVIGGAVLVGGGYFLVFMVQKKK
jgi:formate/nitrite transporter FocA (FNT family)